MSDEIRFSRKWRAEHLVLEALSFVFDEALEALRVSDVGTEDLTISVHAMRMHSESLDTPLDYTWELQVHAHAESELDDVELLDAGKICDAIFDARTARRDIGEPDDER